MSIMDIGGRGCEDTGGPSLLPDISIPTEEVTSNAASNPAASASITITVTGLLKGWFSNQ